MCPASGLRQAALFEIAPSSEIADLIGLAIDLARFEPGLLRAIVRDLEAHALRKKGERAEHQRWVEEQTGTLIETPAGHKEVGPSLEAGRPRMQPLCVLTFLLLRGWLGGCKDERFQTVVQESLSLRIFLENMGQALPSGSTLNENLNAISNETRQRIHRAELALVLDEELDDFEMMRIDSTDARSASAYPTDSGTITKLLCRMCTRLERLDRLGLAQHAISEMSGKRADLRKLNYQIGTLTSSSAKQAERTAREADAEPDPVDPPKNRGKTESQPSAKQRLRRELYEKLYELVEELLPEIEALFLQARNQFGLQSCPPRQRQRQEQFVKDFSEDLESVGRGIEQSRRRICEGKRPNAQGKMPLSVSDPSASFIEKGSWERTFGYRPQLSFSATNLVTAIIVPSGNASDQSQLVATIEQSIANTGIVPRVVSVDDGYTGATQLEESLALGVEVVSFSGARGKQLLGTEKWESEPYAEARKARNGAESGIYVLKKKVGFEQLAASGQERVRGEQYEKVLACNAFKIVTLRGRKRERERRKQRGQSVLGRSQEAA